MHDPDKAFDIAVQQLALAFMHAKFPRRVVRTRSYAAKEDVGPALPKGQVVKVTVELAPESEMPR